MRRILCYGDSNTFGTGPMRDPADDPILPRGARWADQMADLLGRDAWDVIIEGLPGRTTVFDDPVEGEYRNGQRALRATLESYRPLALLIICLGTNDAKQRFNVGAQDIALGVGRLLREAAALGVAERMMAICPPSVVPTGPFAAVMQGADVRMAGLAEHMERVAQVHGATFFDAGTVIEVDPLDGIHWSEASHQVLGAAVAERVRERFG